VCVLESMLCDIGLSDVACWSLCLVVGSVCVSAVFVGVFDICVQCNRAYTSSSWLMRNALWSDTRQLQTVWIARR
jgi:hypothetical protein